MAFKVKGVTSLDSPFFECMIVTFDLSKAVLVGKGESKEVTPLTLNAIKKFLNHFQHSL